MESRAGWRWHGYAAHLCVGCSCAYHLATSIDGKILVSTVGHYLRDGRIQEIGYRRTFETMVFPIDGCDKHGNPVIEDLNELEATGYDDSEDAERGHYAMCEKWADRIAEGRPLEDADGDDS